MLIVLISAMNRFFQILIYLILARAIMSWFVRSPYGAAYKIYTVLIQITEPLLGPCRRLQSRFGLTGPFDFSPIIAIILITVLNSILVQLVRMLII